MVDFNTLLDLLRIQFELDSRLFPSSPTGIIGTALNTPETISAVWDLMKSLFNNFIGIFADLSQIIHIFDFLPSVWVSLFIVLLGLVVGLRIYSFFSDVEIGGFKI